jgi:hypothetical protein
MTDFDLNAAGNWVEGTEVGAFPSQILGVARRVDPALAEDLADVDTDGVVPFTGLSIGPYVAAETPAAPEFDLTVDATGGDFRVRLGSDQTEEIAFDAVAATVEAAIEELGGIGGVTCTGDLDTGMTVAFSDERDLDPTLETGGLTGGGATLVQTVQGSRGGERRVNFIVTE